MIKLIFTWMLCICSMSVCSQARFIDGAKGNWNVSYLDLTTFTGMPKQISFAPDQQVKGYVSISHAEDDDYPRSEIGKFNLRLSGFQITHVYKSGKWYSIQQVNKCTGATIYQIGKATIKVKVFARVYSPDPNIILDPELLGNHTVTLCTGYGGSNCSNEFEETYRLPSNIVRDTPMAVYAEFESYVDVQFIKTQKMLSNWENISGNCAYPDDKKEEPETEVVIDDEDQPRPKPGVSITESIKSKMPLYAEGNTCVSIHHLDGGPQCDDDAIEIRNQCDKHMTVQLALKQSNGYYASEVITTLKSGETRRIQTGCGKTTEGAKFVALPIEQKRRNLLCNPEWYLVSMMDLKGKPYVDVPYEAPKKKPTSTVIPGSSPNITFNQNRTQSQQTQGGSLGDVYFPNANKTKTYQGSKAKEFQKKMSSTEGFDITKGFFGHKKSAGNLTAYTVYRFSNHRWANGNSWFKAKIWHDDPSGNRDTRSSYWTLYGKWERKADEIIVTQWEVGRNAPNSNLYVFKIEGKNLRLIKGPVVRGSQPVQDDLYINYINLPNWPRMSERQTDLTTGFPPRN